MLCFLSRMHIALFVMYFLVPLLYILRAAMFPQRAMSMPYRTLTVCVLMKKKIVCFINKVFSLKSSTRSQVYQQDVWCRYDSCLLLHEKLWMWNWRMDACHED